MKKLIIAGGFVLFVIVTKAQPPPPPRPPGIEERLKKTNEVLKNEVHPSPAQQTQIEAAYKIFLQRRINYEKIIHHHLPRHLIPR